jgi:hypothetical protein
VNSPRQQKGNDNPRVKEVQVEANGNGLHRADATKGSATKGSATKGLATKGSATILMFDTSVHH